MKRAYRGPRTFAARSRLALLACDLATVTATALAALTRQRQSAPAIVAAVTLVPLSFASLGLYSRSYAAAPRDELYAAVLPAAATLGGFLALSALPGVRLDRGAGAAAVACGLFGCAVNRIALHDRLAAAEHPPARPPMRAALKFAKRCMDLALTVSALPLALLIGGGVGLLIVTDDGGPILFSQERVGRDGRPFRLYKFRTMKRGSGDAWAVRGDSRITRIGHFLRRTSLDELPQLINVLRGEMSLVGPRPEMLAYAETFTRTLPRYAERARVKPGITGWAQVTLPRILSSADMHDVLAADLLYVDHCSLAFDATILAKTAVEVLFHRAV